MPPGRHAVLCGCAGGHRAGGSAGRENIGRDRTGGENVWRDQGRENIWIHCIQIGNPIGMGWGGSFIFAMVGYSLFIPCYPMSVCIRLDCPSIPAG